MYLQVLTYCTCCPYGARILRTPAVVVLACTPPPACTAACLRFASYASSGRLPRGQPTENAFRRLRGHAFRKPPTGKPLATNAGRGSLRSMAAGWPPLGRLLQNRRGLVDCTVSRLVRHPIISRPQCRRAARFPLPPTSLSSPPGSPFFLPLNFALVGWKLLSSPTNLTCHASNSQPSSAGRSSPFVTSVTRPGLALLIQATPSLPTPRIPPPRPGEASQLLPTLGSTEARAKREGLSTAGEGEPLCLQEHARLPAAAAKLATLEHRPYLLTVPSSACLDGAGPVLTCPPKVSATHQPALSPTVLGTRLPRAGPAWPEGARKKGLCRCCYGAGHHRQPPPSRGSLPAPRRDRPG
ncbi:hypothetical protein RJ55_08482 [Drechmeria coniospora]|nr:hypothetical protein RJ55_08482 [Drechmeria coniospora]